MAFLYINSNGEPWRKHSYSAGMTFDNCPMKYYYQKVLGYKEKNNRARFEFGKAVETAIQRFHDNGGNVQDAISCFRAEWLKQVENKNLQYTAVEKDWGTLSQMGTDMVKLYAIRQPSLPIPLGGNVVFQREAKREVFPGDPNYGEIEDAGRLDIIAYAPPDHSLLPKLDWKPEYGAFRPVIVDIKTSGVDLAETYGLAAYDTQLRRYSWLSGIRDVALLWFVKKSLKVQKGSSITLLEDAGYMKAGEEAVVGLVNKDGSVWVVKNDFLIGEMEKAQGEKAGKTDQTKAAKERAEQWLRENATLVAETAITKQRLQFNAGFVTVKSADDAGLAAQDQIIRIVNAWKRQAYPNTFGIRYPHDDKSDPYFRAFVLGDEKFKDENFTVSAAEEDLFADTDTENA